MIEKVHDELRQQHEDVQPVRRVAGVLDVLLQQQPAAEVPGDRAERADVEIDDECEAASTRPGDREIERDAGDAVDMQVSVVVVGRDVHGCGVIMPKRR